MINVDITSLETKYLLELLDDVVSPDNLEVSMRTLCLLQFSNKLRYALYKQLKSERDATNIVRQDSEDSRNSRQCPEDGR